MNSWWINRYVCAKNYYVTYGNLDVPSNFRTDDGVTSKEDGKYSLGRWIRYQRTNYVNLTDEQKSMLSSIGFVTSKFDELWNTYYELLVLYFNMYGDSNVGFHFITYDGISYDKDGYRLGEWVHTQRRKYAELNYDRKEKLNKVNFIVNLGSVRWESHYQLAKKFFEFNHHLSVPQKFCTSNGIDFDENGFALGKWISSMRTEFDNLSEDRKHRLLDIGFTKNGRFTFDRNIQLLKDYYDKNHTTGIAFSYKTESGVNLGLWVHAQRARFESITDINRKELYSNGFIIDHENNKQYVYYLLSTYGLLDYFTVMDMYKHSVQELQAKIMFLIESGLPLVIDGKLNEIFNMGNKELIEKYGLSLSDIINGYTIGVDDAYRLLKK